MAGGQPGDLRSLPTDELVRLCLEHNEEAWAEFLGRYGDLIHSTIQKRVGLGPADREEGFQNTVVAIYRNLGRLRDQDKLVPWIVRIAYHQGVNRIRARARARETAIEDLSETALHDSLDPADLPSPPEEVQDQLVRAQQARELLALVPERCRRLLTLLIYADPPLDYAEVARREGIPIGSIGPTRARCLEKMRQASRARGWPEL